jgi:outer membrane protein OmpA-like peptidoglycan-associated protein
MQNVDSISLKINRGEGSVGALINNKKLYQQANATAAEAKAAATAFDENMEALKHNFLLRGFFRKRGYEDSNELGKHEISKLPSEQPNKKFVYDASQIFDKPDTAKLKNQKVLNEPGKFLEDNKFGLAVVVGYTGMKGDTDKDRVLAQARTMVVRDYLDQHFKLDDTRIKTLGLGKTNQPDDSSRVEILVYPVGANAPKAQDQSASKR